MGRWTSQRGSFYRVFIVFRAKPNSLFVYEGVIKIKQREIVYNVGDIVNVRVIGESRFKDGVISVGKDGFKFVVNDCYKPKGEVIDVRISAFSRRRNCAFSTEVHT